MNLATLARPNVVQRSIVAAVKRITDAGLPVEAIDEFHYRVDGRFDFWPATLTFKDTATGRTGYTTARLIAAAKVQA